MVYAWKNGTRFTADAEKIVSELDQLGEQKTPDAVVKKASGKDTELHKCFTWDDSVAADKYRLEEARSLLRSIVIIPEDPSPTVMTHEIRAFENVCVGESRAYISTRTVLSNKDLREQVFGEIRGSIMELEHKAEAYEYLSGTFAKVRDRLKKARELVSV